MSVLEWMLISEVVLLLAAGFFYAVSLAVAGKDPDDPLSIFWRTFWKVFLRRGRAKFKTAVKVLEIEKARQYQEMKQHGDVDAIKELLREHMDGEDVDDKDIAALLEADAAERATVLPALDVGADDAAARPNVAQINVKVIPFAERDEVVGMGADGITIQVTAAAEEGRANKVVISLVSGALGVKPYQVSLLKGHYRPRKTLQIAGLAQDAVDQKLSSLS